jgi:hypothetical protein
MLLVALFLRLLLPPLLLPLVDGRAGLLLPGCRSAALLAGFCCTMQFRARTTCTSKQQQQQQTSRTSVTTALRWPVKRKPPQHRLLYAPI